MKNSLSYFTKGELFLWLSSVGIILMSFFLFDKENYFNLISSLIGVTSLILNAKGNPVGLVLMIIFSLFYGAVSYTFDYYGEMVTYLGMTLPTSAFALISWLKNPYKGNKAQVSVGRVKGKDITLMLILTFAVTLIFYFILAFLDTANLIPSTLSVATSFAAAYLTMKRSPYFALVYGLNDMVLIVLWSLAVREDRAYISVLICFIIFLINDLYGFISWKRMEKRQMRD